MLSLRDAPLIRQWIAKGPDQDADSMLVTRSVKAYYDGALGSRGARLIDDYADRAGHRGISGEGYGFDHDLAAAVMNSGFQIGVHAIGDAGNREVLDFLEASFKANPRAGMYRHRIEHAQVIAPSDLARPAKLGVIASMEPPHAVEDKAWAEDRLGQQRILGAYAWRRTVSGSLSMPTTRGPITASSMACMPPLPAGTSSCSHLAGGFRNSG
jgi:predicted amidohydrolase YtcJ